MASPKVPRLTRLLTALDERDFLSDMTAKCRPYHVTLAEVLGKGRQTAVVRAREACVMVLLDAGLSLSHAAELLDMHHTGLMAARDRFAERKK
jgi:chromosomal replication initiation ATPase DnaA